MRKFAYAAAAAGLMLASSAQAFEAYTDYTPSKEVWDVTMVKVNPNRIDDYLAGLKQTWMTGCDIAATTSGGTGVGPGASKYDLITISPEPWLDFDITAGPRRSARWSFRTSPWSVPRERQSCEGGDVEGRLAPARAHCQGEPAPSR